MKSDILNKMAEIVANTMTSFQSDFEQYDRPYIESGDAKFPLIWIVGSSHTFLLRLGEYKERFLGNERVRWAYINGDNTFDSYIDYYKHDNDKLFLITESAISEINISQARSAIQDYVRPAVHAWIEQNGPLPKKTKVTVKIQNISVAKLKELISECWKHNDNSLLLCLKRFHQYMRVAADQYITVSYNPGCNEFTFWETINGKTGLVGGIVFHGWPESGYQSNNSVQLTPQYGWATHT